MINIVFRLTFQNPLSKWTLESKSKYIVDNKICHLVIFQKYICASANIIYNQITVQLLSNILGSKVNQTMKFGQVIEYNKGSILKKIAENKARRLASDLFLFF